MAVYSVGTPIVSAQVKFKQDGNTVIRQIKKGDELINLTIENYPQSIVVESATVVGFTLKSFQLPRGANRVYDGVPTYLPDTRGDHRYGVVEETSEIDRVLIKVPAKTEGGKATKHFVKLDMVLSFEGGEEIEAGSEDDQTSVKNPSEETEEGSGTESETVL